MPPQPFGALKVSCIAAASAPKTSSISSAVSLIPIACASIVVSTFQGGRWIHKLATAASKASC